MLVRSRMSRDVVTTSPDATMAEALALTRAHRIRHLPVLDQGRVVGVISDRDLRLAMPPLGSMPENERRELMATRRVGELMARDLITAPPEMPVEEAAKLLYQHRIGCLPVTEGDRLVGILTESDLLRAFVELFGAHKASSRIEVRLPNRPGELARVVRLIGVDHRINISGMVVPPLPSTAEALAIIHLQTLDPRKIVNALEKMGYPVGWPSLDLDIQAESPQPVGL